MNRSTVANRWNLDLIEENHERWRTDPFFQEYLVHYTNASVIINPDFRDTEALGGVFSGYLPDEQRYEFDTWQYAAQQAGPAAQTHPSQSAEPRTQSKL